MAFTSPRSYGERSRAKRAGEGLLCFLMRQPLTRRLRCAQSPTSPRKRGEVKGSKFPIQFSNSHTHSFSRNICAREAVVHPSNHEGHGAPRGAPCVVSLPAPFARRWFSGSASPCGAPLRRFWAKGPYFRDRTSTCRASDPAGFRRPSSCPRPATEGRAT